MAQVYKQTRSDTRSTEELARGVWREADAVCFDVDSTVVKIEGLDELAHFLGVAEEVKAWTKRAMGGSVLFQDSFRARLDICKPSREKIAEFNAMHHLADHLSPGVKELIELLYKMNKQIFLVSGGMRELIEPLAEELNIPPERIFANKLLYDFNGEYVTFDGNQPTSRTGGKPVVVQRVKKEFSKVVMIGDGVTDMEAHPPADTFIGYGGTVVRDKVYKGAPWFVHHFQELLEELLLPSETGLKLAKRMNVKYNSEMKNEKRKPLKAIKNTSKKQDTEKKVNN